MTTLQEKYEVQNLLQEVSETDSFTPDRYKQFYKFLPGNVKKVLDVGCNTGRGGLTLVELNSSLSLVGMDCVEQRLNLLPECYSEKIHGLSTRIPVEDCAFDAIVSGEFIQCLYPANVDQTLCEFQRVLRVGGRLLLTTPNPHYLRHRLYKTSIYDLVGQLSQHYPEVLKFRLSMHGFSNIRTYGSGKISQYLGYRFPLKAFYGSYLMVADKI